MARISAGRRKSKPRSCERRRRPRSPPSPWPRRARAALSRHLAAAAERLFDEPVGAPGQQRARSTINSRSSQRQRLELDDGEHHQQRPVPEIERIADQADPHHAAGSPAAIRLIQAAGADSSSALPATGSSAHQPGKARCTSSMARASTISRAPATARRLLAASALIDRASTAAQRCARSNSQAPRERQIEGRGRIGADQRDIEDE